MAELAPNCSVSQLHHVARRWRSTEPPATEPDPAEAEPAPEPEPEREGERERPDEPQSGTVDPATAEGTASWWFDDDGRFHLHLTAPTLDGALVAQAIDEAKDALFHAGDTGAAVFDAVMEMVNRSLASIGVASRADRYRVYAFMDTEGAWLDSGMRLPAEILDQILSDGHVRPVWTTGGIPVNIGRGAHAVPNHLRRLVHERDGGQCRNCASTVGLHVHHYHWWTRGGRTDLDNLGLHCSRCHRAIHRGDIVPSGNPNLPATDPGSLRSHRRDGAPLRAVRRFRPPRVPPRPGTWTRPTHERLDERWVEFADDDGTGPPTTPRRSRPRHHPAA